MDLMKETTMKMMCSHCCRVVKGKEWNNPNHRTCPFCRRNTLVPRAEKKNREVLLVAVAIK